VSLLSLAVKARAGGWQLGASVMCPGMRRAWLLDSPDTPFLMLAESLAVQHGVREVLLAEDSSNDEGRDAVEGSVVSLARRVGATLTRVPSAQHHPDVPAAAEAVVADRPLAREALSVAVAYLQVGDLDPWQVSAAEPHVGLQYDVATARALRVFSPSAGIRSDDDRSLYGLMNETVSAPGARKLQSWLRHPAVDAHAIRKRQQVVDLLCALPALREVLRGRACLRRMPDLERLAVRLATKQSKLADLMGVYGALQRCHRILQEVRVACDETAGSGDEPDARAQSFRKTYTATLEQCFEETKKLQALVEEAVDLEARRRTSSPWLIKASFTPTLTRLQASCVLVEQNIDAEFQHLRSLVKGPESRVKAEESPAHGHHMRMTKKDASTASLASIPGIRVLAVQKGGVLFQSDTLRSHSVELGGLRKQYMDAQEAVERKVMEVAGTYVPLLGRIGALLGDIDALASFAQVAVDENWVRPTLIDITSEHLLELTDLRHPVVEHAVRNRPRGQYVPSNLCLGCGMQAARRVAVLTGPNMGGKSTFASAVAICQILAQIGSFVPAASATIPLRSHIAARTGAGDSPTKLISTFMSEMLHASSLLKGCSQSSLVIVDELGRGTSTHDGYGIAHAVLQALVDSGCTALFATHFHELTARVATDRALENLHVSAHATGDAIRMLYDVLPGACDRSFGVHVARIAELPVEITRDAAAYLDRLEGDRPGAVDQESTLDADTLELEASSVSDRTHSSKKRKTTIGA